MDILGCTFDDSVFLEVKERVCECVSSYEPKICEAEWFCCRSAITTDEILDKQKVLKFRGDLAFRRGKFEAALEAYKACLHWIPENNMTIKRDVLDGMARCCTKLGRRDQAQELVELLNKEASNTCHLINLLLLKVCIYEHFGSLWSEMFCLQHLCSLLPFNPWYWFRLGHTCYQLLDAKISTESLNVSEEMGENHEEEAELREDQLWLKTCVSFIRTRLLLKILRQQQSSFVLKRSEKVLEMTEQLLQQLNPKETAVQKLIEVMSEDLIPEKMKEDYQDGEGLHTVCLQTFSERWWSRVLLTNV